jgi:hypothetical protein
VPLAVGTVAGCVVGIATWRSTRPWTLMLDTGNVYLGQTVPAFRTWITGRVPEWSDLLWGGLPILADPTSAALYAPHLVSLLLSGSEPLRFFDVALALHVGLFTAGSAMLLRTLGVGSAWVAFGGVLAALCPFAYFCGRAFFVVFGAQAWWPWAFVAAELLTRPATPHLGIAMTLGWVALAAQVFVGFPENAAYCGVVTILWVLTRRSGLAWGARVRRLVVLGVGAGALAAPQLLPTLAFLPLSHRAERPGYAELASFWITDFSRLVIPGRHGLNDPPAFLGLASLVLLAVAVLARRPRAGFLLVLAGVSMGLAMGPQVGLYGWLHEIPPFSHFRSPVKIYAFTEFAVTWGAALGADALWRPGAGRT